MSSLARRIQKRIFKKRGTPEVPLLNRDTHEPLTKSIRLPGEVNPFKMPLSAVPLYAGQQYRYNN